MMGALTALCFLIVVPAALAYEECGRLDNGTLAVCTDGTCCGTSFCCIDGFCSGNTCFSTQCIIAVVIIIVIIVVFVIIIIICIVYGKNNSWRCVTCMCCNTIPCVFCVCFKKRKCCCVVCIPFKESPSADDHENGDPECPRSDPVPRCLTSDPKPNPRPVPKPGSRANPNPGPKPEPKPDY